MRKDLASLSYTSIDDVVAVVRRAGERAILAKMDVKQAYRNILTSNVYVDNVLPFGLRSAPLLFTAVADALQWIAEQRGIRWVFHYIDDFITIRAQLPQSA